MINQDSTNAPLDFSTLLGRMNNNSKMASLLFKKFEETLPNYYAEFSDSFEAVDLNQVKDCAHKLKGSALTVSAGAIADAAGNLEEAAKAEDMDLAAQQYSALTDEMDRFLSWAQATDLDVLMAG